jgi:hypothetical protein
MCNGCKNGAENIRATRAANPRHRYKRSSNQNLLNRNLLPINHRRHQSHRYKIAPRRYKISSFPST